jgi:deoxyadenosine/deoxycytidine kinase
MKPLLWVEGIIGCGKTTFTKEVGNRLNLRVLQEPVDSNPYLAKFYKDKAKYAFAMQIFLLHKRFAMQQLASMEATGVGGFDGAILDRSLAGDRVFAKMLCSSGDISQLDWENYENCYDIMCRTLLPPTRLIFLDVQPETAYERMQARNRDAEAGVPLDYLRALRDGYLQLIEEAERGLTPWSHAVKVLRLVWDPINDMPNWDRVADSIRDSLRGRATLT